MSIATASWRPVRHIGDEPASPKSGIYQSAGQVAICSRSALHLDSIASLLPLCCGRQPTIAKTCDSIYIRANLNVVDRVEIVLSEKRKIVSTGRSSIETYVVKGLSVPAKKLTSDLLASTSAGLFSTLSTLMTSSLSSLIGFSLNLILVSRDFKKNGGSPAYASFTYSFYTLQLLALTIASVVSYLVAGPAAIVFAVVLTTVIFFVLGLFAKGLFSFFDRRTAAKIDARIIEEYYRTIKL